MPFTEWSHLFCGEKGIMRHPWLAVFGEKDTDDQDDDGGFTSCDPKECTSDSGICVDCTKCTHHCICEKADAVKTDPPSPEMAAKQLTPNSSSSEDDNQNGIEFTVSDYA
jgi:hypothetical protein